MIVIPMAGDSSRFFSEGYNVPKYKLSLWGKPVFDWVVLSFYRYFNDEEFIFVVKKRFDEDNFVEQRAKLLGIKNFTIRYLDKTTRGQAETVFLSIDDQKKRDPLIIFNIDTLRLDFQKPTLKKLRYGYLEVFKGDGSHWSFVFPEKDNNIVSYTTEKVRVSDLCSNGLYQFENIADFYSSCNSAFEESDFSNGEFYVAPLYNRLIKQNKSIQYVLCNPSQNLFCGTPEEYRLLEKNLEAERRVKSFYKSYL
jgi:NDP-sugar pyrophosphorylase family protein